MKQKIIRKVFNTGVDEMNSNSSNKNFNEKENTEMKRLNLYEARYTYHGQGNELRICCLKSAMTQNTLIITRKPSGMDFRRNTR